MTIVPARNTRGERADLKRKLAAALKLRNGAKTPGEYRAADRALLRLRRLLDTDVHWLDVVTADDLKNAVPHDLRGLQNLRREAFVQALSIDLLYAFDAGIHLGRAEEAEARGARQRGIEQSVACVGWRLDKALELHEKGTAAVTPEAGKPAAIR